MTESHRSGRKQSTAHPELGSLSRQSQRCRGEGVYKIPCRSVFLCTAHESSLVACRHAHVSTAWRCSGTSPGGPMYLLLSMAAAYASPFTSLLQQYQTAPPDEVAQKLQLLTLEEQADLFKREVLTADILRRVCQGSQRAQVRWEASSGVQTCETIQAAHQYVLQWGAEGSIGAVAARQSEQLQVLTSFREVAINLDLQITQAR